MDKKHILIIEDELDVVKVLKKRLQSLLYEVTSVGTGEEGISAAIAKAPDLIILDLTLPDINGLEVCKRLRDNQKTKNMPILMLTAKGENVDEVVGLELGADDYVKKPFDFAVLASRIGNLLKRSKREEAGAEGAIKSGKLTVDHVRHKVFVEEKEIALTEIEFRILQFFVKNPGRLFSRDELLNGAWKENVAINDRAIDVHINGIRAKIKPVSDYIETVRGAGYRFKEFN